MHAYYVRPTASYSPEGEYGKYSTGQKNGVDAFGCNSAKVNRFG